MRYLLLTIGWLVAVCPFLAADDWPQWRGPERTDISQESGLLESWPPDGPRQVWIARNAGVGYSGPAIVGTRLYTLGSRDNVSYLICLDAVNGQELWSTPIGETLTNAWGDGPRSTPTVDGGFVFALTGVGDVACFSAASGQLVWRKNLVTDLGGQVPQWGYCESVLVEGPLVICTPGGEQGAIVALQRSTGEVVWRSTECVEPAQYASIVPVDHHGRRLYLQLFMKKLVAVDSTAGRLVWEVNWPGRIAVIPTPIVDGTRVYVTAGYGAGCMLVDFAGDQPQVIYENKVMKNHHGGVILLDGYLYGHSDKTGWICQDFATGDRVWRNRKELGKGAMGYADGHFYCLDEETGTVVLIDADAEAWQSRGSFTLQPQTELRKPQGRIWTHPVIANGFLYLRDQDLIYCYDVRQP